MEKRGPAPASPRKLRLAPMQQSMMVGKGCESCRKWQEHFYWEHMDVTKIRFFKLLTGDFAKGISMPEKFVKNFNGRITEVLDLKAPSGETWRIGLDKRDHELLLVSGWEDFVRAHELQENDLLMFTCSGNSSFEVLIFDACGCEKLSSLFSNKTGPNVTTSFNDIASRGQHAELSDSDDATTPSLLVGSTHYASTSKKSSGKKPRKQPESPNTSNDHVEHEEVGDADSDDDYANSKYYYSRIANWLNDDEREEILRLAPIQSENPAFMAVLQKNHCQRRNNLLTVPSRFAADHLQEGKQEIILCRPTRKNMWSVRYDYNRYSRGFRNRKFFTFVRDNKLREGDICIFELMKGTKKRKVTMNVHVIRKVGERFVLVV